MKKTRRRSGCRMRFLWFFSAFVGLASAAHADSDGYYCAGRGYLAVEFRSGITPNVARPQVLKVASFDEALGPRWTGELVVDDLQPYALTCGARLITLEGFGTRAQGLISYVVTVDA